MTTKFRVYIGRAINGGGNFHLYVTDEISGVRFFDCHMSADQFADFMSNREAQVEGEVSALHVVGMKAENKTEIVPFDWSGKGANQSPKIRKALKPFEVDGWKARVSDLTNHHCRVSAGKQRVVFFRHVDPKTGEPVI